MKKILITILLLLLTGCSGDINRDFGAEDIDSKAISTTTKISNELIEISDEFDTKINDGVFDGIAEKTIDGITYKKVTGYTTSKGDTGYQVIIETSEFIQSIGYGVESSSRSWIKYKEEEVKIATTTKIKL